MAWNTYARTRIGANKSCPTSIATWIRDRDRMLAQMPIDLEIANSSTTNASFTTVTTFRLFVPEWAPGNYTLHIRPLVNGNGQLRLQDDSTTTNGGALTFNVASLQDPGSDVTLAISSSMTTGVRLFNVQLLATAGTVVVENVDRMTAWFEVT